MGISTRRNSSRFKCNPLTLIFLGSIAPLLASCFPSEKNQNQSFISSIKTEIEENGKTTLYKSLGAKWDSICVFYPANSNPYSAYEAYLNHQSNAGKSSETLERRKYRLIVILESQQGREILSFKNHPITINNKKYWFSMKNGNSRVGGCLSGDVTFELSDNYTIKIY